MGIQNNYVESNITEESTLVTHETEISFFTTDTPYENEKLKDMLAKQQETIPQEVL